MLIKVKNHYGERMYRNAFTGKAVKVLDQDLKSDFIRASKRVSQNPWTILHNLGLA